MLRTELLGLSPTSQGLSDRGQNGSSSPITRWVATTIIHYMTLSVAGKVYAYNRLLVDVQRYVQDERLTSPQMTKVWKGTLTGNAKIHVLTCCCSGSLD